MKRARLPAGPRLPALSISSLSPQTRDRLALAVIFGFVACEAWELTWPGIATGQDVLASLYRIFVLDQSWRDGVLFPRLAQSLTFDYGGPLFLFYPPAAAFLSQLIHLTGLGFVSSLKVTSAATLLLGALGAFLYIRLLFASRPAAVAGALAFSLAPYQLTNIYVRGAEAEALAIALLPWCLWAFHRLPTARPAGACAAAAAVLGLIILSHNGTALFWLPILLCYVLAVALTRRSWSSLGLSAASIALALGMSAFFWLPALAEMRYVKAQALVEGMFDPVSHLASWPGLIQGTILPSFGPGSNYRLALLPAIIALVGTLTLPWQKRAHRPWVLFHVMVVAAVLVLQTPVATVFWTDLPLVRFIQFPWRLLGSAGLSVAVLCAAIPACMGGLPKWRTALPWMATAGLGAGLLLTAALGLYPAYTRALEQGTIHNEDVGLSDMYERGRLNFELFTDFAPIWLQAAMPDVAAGQPPSTQGGSISRDDVQIRVRALNARDAELEVSAGRALPLSLHWTYFPGWQATVDGAPVAVYPRGDLGLVTVNVPAGTHQVKFTLGDTPVRAAGTAISWLAAACGLGLAAYALRGRRRLLIVPAAGVIVLLGLWLAYRPAAGTLQDMHVLLANGAQLVGYRLDKSTYRAGDTVDLVLYWYAAGPIDQDYRVFVHVRDASDQNAIAQHDGDPVYGFTPATRWVPGELLVDHHTLHIRDDQQSGRFTVVAGMYAPDTVQNVDLVAPLPGMPQDRIVLATIEIVTH